MDARLKRHVLQQPDEGGFALPADAVQPQQALVALAVLDTADQAPQDGHFLGPAG